MSDKIITQLRGGPLHGKTYEISILARELLVPLSMTTRARYERVRAPASRDFWFEYMRTETFEPPPPLEPFYKDDDDRDMFANEDDG